MRYVLIILFAVVLAAPTVLNWKMKTPEQAQHSEEVEELVIITGHSEPIRREFREAFSAYYLQKFGKAVDINYLMLGGGGSAEMKRTLESARDGKYVKTGTYEIDLVWGGGDTLFDRDLKPHLQGLELDPQFMKETFPEPALAGLRLYEGSNPPLWYGTALSSFGIGYNVDVAKALGLPEPKTWADLKDPKYRNWILLADPTRSSSARTMFMVIVERAMADAVAQGRSASSGWADGMGLIRQICANGRNFNDQAVSVVSVVSSGDAAAAMMIDFFARSQIQYVGEDRMRYIEPANATVINPDPIAMIKGSQHAELAKQFVEYVLSEEGQRLFNVRAGQPGGPRLTSLRRLPVRRSVYSDMTGFTDQVNPFEQTTSFNTSRARTTSFPIIGELIQASCMDVLDELKATREAVLSSPRAAELDARIGKFPFDQDEVLRRLDQYGKASSAQKLSLMKQWTDEFRAEYQSLRVKARQ